MRTASCRARPEAALTVRPWDADLPGAFAATCSSPVDALSSRRPASAIVSSHICAKPPSTKSSAQLTKLLSSEAINTTAFATSSGVPNRPRGMPETMPAFRQGRRRARDPAVLAGRFAGRPMLAARAGLVSGLPLMHRTFYIRLARVEEAAGAVGSLFPLEGGMGLRSVVYDF